MHIAVGQIVKQCFKEGVPRSIHLPGEGVVRGIHVTTGVSFSPSTHFDVVVNIDTTSEDIVHLAACPRAPSESDILQLNRLQEKRRPLKLHSLMDYAGVLLPVVKSLTGTPKKQAAQKKISSLRTARGVGREWASYHLPYIISGPFLIWVERPGLAHPLMAFHVTEQQFCA